MNFLGIVPILVQWLAILSWNMNNNTHSPDTMPYGSSYPSTPQGTGPTNYGKSQWSLLNDLQSLPEDEIEHFLPQICNLLVDSNMINAMDYGVYDHFRNIIIKKCAGCLPFGMRVCALLKALASTPVESLFKQPFASLMGQGNDNSNDAMLKEEKLRLLQEQAEDATHHGESLPHRISELRTSYMNDMNFLLESLSKLGTDLKRYPITERAQHLRNGVSQVNNLLYNRMLSRGTSTFNSNGGMGSGQAQGGNGNYRQQPQQPQQPPYINAHTVAASMPEAAAYSLHIPLQHCRERTQRVLRFVESECEMLPSKERTPYLIVAEVIEQPFTCKSSELFVQRHTVGITVADVILGKANSDAIDNLYLHGRPSGRSSQSGTHRVTNAVKVTSHGHTDNQENLCINEQNGDNAERMVDMFARPPENAYQSYTGEPLRGNGGAMGGSGRAMGSNGDMFDDMRGGSSPSLPHSPPPSPHNTQNQQNQPYTREQEYYSDGNGQAYTQGYPPNSPSQYAPYSDMYHVPPGGYPSQQQAMGPPKQKQFFDMPTWKEKVDRIQGQHS